MMLYFFVALAPMVLSTLFPALNDSKKAKRQYCLIIGLILFLFLALRAYTIGSTDTLNYYNAMKRAIVSPSWKSFYSEEYFEAGSQFYIWLLSRVFHDPQWVIVVSSLIYLSAVFFCVWKYSQNISMSLTLYVCLGLMTFEIQAMRQSLAISLCLFAFHFAKKQKLIPFLLLVVLAMQFHQTALVFFPVYLICRIPINERNLALTAVIAALAVFYSSRLVTHANEVFDRHYYDTANGGGYVATLIYALVILVTLWLIPKPYARHLDASTFYLLIIGFVCYLVRYTGALAAERVSFYYIFSQFLILPNTIEAGKIDRQSRIFINVLVPLLAVVLLLYRIHGSDFVPYQFFWEVAR